MIAITKTADIIAGHVVMQPARATGTGGELVCGPNDFFEISSNNSPDPEDDDEAVHEPQDYTGDYPLEGDDGGEGEE